MYTPESQKICSPTSLALAASDCYSSILFSSYFD
jgi:hypothetical protein